MAAKDRRERVRQATRQGILDGARNIARAEGWPAVTIRKVADAIEYSPSIVYEYFSSKDAISLALLQEGFVMLTQAMRHAASITADPHARMQQLGAAYISFASAYPELYQVMHGFAGATIGPQERGESALPLCVIVEEAVLAWADAARISVPDARARAELLWSVLHGIVSLTLIDHVLPVEHSQPMANDALDALLAGWHAAAHAC